MLFRPLASLLVFAAAVQATLSSGVSGLELGISTKGSVTGSYTAPDISQISHFVGLGANIIRIPFGWSFMVGGQIGGELDATYFALVDTYVQAALSASSDCTVLLELDSFGGFGGKAFGSGSVSVEAYADLWAKLGAKYSGQARVSFSLRNSVSGGTAKWAAACQAAVKSIRASGCTTQKIALGLGGGGLIETLLGTWGSAMLAIEDSISLTDGLVFDVNSFLDSGALGLSGVCIGSNVLAINSMHSWLSRHNRRAFLHTGGGSNDACLRFLGLSLAKLETYSDTFLGFTAAGAGAVSGGLSIAPRSSGKDCSLVSQILAPRFPHASAAVSASASASLGASAGASAAASATLSAAASASASASLTSSVTVSLPSLGGVVLSGLEFGIDGSGSLTGGLTGYTAPDVSQIGHFVGLGANLIRLPLGWNYAVGGVCGAASLDVTYFALIDTYVQAALAASADCRIVLEVDSYGHFGGVAIGSDDVTVDKFASFWGLLAAKYSGESRVLFGISNGFSGSVDVSLWAQACQAAVVSIRAAGAVSQTISLGFGAHAEFSGLLSLWGSALLGIKDSLGAAGGIIFDVNLFLDAGAAGTSATCTLGASSTVSAIHSWLGQHGRQGLISTGAGSNSGCISSLQTGLTEIKKSASILGFSVAGAGAASSSAAGLSIIPNGSTDVSLITQCVRPFFPDCTSCSASSSVAGPVPTGSFSKKRLDADTVARRRQFAAHQARAHST